VLTNVAAVPRGSVGIQCDDVLHLTQRFEIADLHGKRIEVAVQIFVKVEQLTALAFPAHPYALASVEDAMAVEEIERPVGFAFIANVQLADKFYGEIDERIGVIFTGTGDRVRQVGQQTETQIGIGIGEKMDFQSFNHFADLFLVHQQRRHDHQRSEFARNTAAEVHLWQRLGLE
jgi:hypothetical protein